MNLLLDLSSNSLAVVGMDVDWTGCSSTNRVDARSAMDATRRESSAMLHVARRALQDAGLEGSARVTVLAAGAALVQSEWSWAMRVEDLSSHSNPLAGALQAAHTILENNEAEAVVFAAVSGPFEAPSDAAVHPSGFGFDREVHGWRAGHGAGAVVWMALSRARWEDRRVYAVIQSAAWAEGEQDSQTPGTMPLPPKLDDVRDCCRAALDAARVTPDQIGYVEAFAAGVDALDGIEIAGLVQTYRCAEQDLTTALGSGLASTGYLGAAAGLAGLVRAALCLYQREIPGAPGWSAPKLPALWRGAPFYVPGESRAWFHPRGNLPRHAALNVIGNGGSFLHAVLCEIPELAKRPSHAVNRGGFYLYPLSGASLEEVLAGLESLRQSLVEVTSLDDLAADYYAAAVRREEAPYALAIVGHDAAELVREIEFAQKALPGAWENGTEWQTPLGSCCTPQPVGRAGGAVLVYPGAFNSYPMVGKDLFRLFPGLYEYMDTITDDLGGVIHERMLYPRSLAALTKEALGEIEKDLLADATAMLISGTALAMLYTRILRDAFKLCPTAAFGYSLGENAMLYATGVWGQGDGAATRLRDSDAFRVRLAGPMLAVREHWGIGRSYGHAENPLWSNYLVMAGPEKVLPILEKESHVYLTHVNAPRQVVIGGDPQGCQRVLAELRASTIQAPFDYALHCEVMRSEFDVLAYLHDWPVEKDPGLRMYSAAGYDTLRLEQDVIAQSMAEMLTSPLDFPRLVNRVYDDGSRVFIEAGAGGNCARWVSETLKGRPHLSISLNRRGADDYSTLVRGLARLYSHRVVLDLSPLYASGTRDLRTLAAAVQMDEKAR